MSDQKSNDSKTQNSESSKSSQASKAAEGSKASEGLKGATTSSFMSSQAPPAQTTPAAPTTPPGPSGVIPSDPAAPAAIPDKGFGTVETGAPVPLPADMPVTEGNRHMLIGVDAPASEVPGQASSGTQPTVGGPGTANPSAGLTRTVGLPESQVEPIEQVGNTVIIPGDTADESRPEFAPGKPKPRTDVDADPHEVTEPGFQGLDRANPLPSPTVPEKSVEHRGAPNEPRVVGVTSVGDPPIQVVGSESSEAQELKQGEQAKPAPPATPAKQEAGTSQTNQANKEPAK